MLPENSMDSTYVRKFHLKYWKFNLDRVESAWLWLKKKGKGNWERREKELIKG